MSVSKITRRAKKVVFGENSCIEQENGTTYLLSERGNNFIGKTIRFGIWKSQKFSVNETYFSRETGIFTEQNENLMMNEDDKMKEVEMKNGLETIQKLKCHSMNDVRRSREINSRLRIFRVWTCS